MYLQLIGTLSACIPRFFTDKETGKQVEYYESGIRTKDQFVTLTSKDFRKFEGKECAFKVQAIKEGRLYKLKAVDISLVDGDDRVIE